MADGFDPDRPDPARPDPPPPDEPPGIGVPYVDEPSRAGSRSGRESAFPPPEPVASPRPESVPPRPVPAPGDETFALPVSPPRARRRPASGPPGDSAPPRESAPRPPPGGRGPRPFGPYPDPPPSENGEPDDRDEPWPARPVEGVPANPFSMPEPLADGRPRARPVPRVPVGLAPPVLVGQTKSSGEPSPEPPDPRPSDELPCRGSPPRLISGIEASPDPPPDELDPPPVPPPDPSPRARSGHRRSEPGFRGESPEGGQVPGPLDPSRESSPGGAPVGAGQPPRGFESPPAMSSGFVPSQVRTSSKLGISTARSCSTSSYPNAIPSGSSRERA